MKIKWQYLIYVIGFFFLLKILGETYFYFQGKQIETYRVIPWSVYATLTFSPIGLYLGLPALIKEFKKQGKWKVNYQKLIIIGLPLLFLTFFWYFPFSYPLPDFLAKTRDVFRLGGITAVGYIVIVSFTKENK